MESAGVAIEIENLAKLYNRNFLLNDGRPGGLLVLRGEIDDDDKEELRSRFRGNIGRVGSTTVVSADDGVDFVDFAFEAEFADTGFKSVSSMETLLADPSIKGVIITVPNEQHLPVAEQIARAADAVYQEPAETVWQMQTAGQNGHPAPFPEELPRRLILLYSRPGDVVLDPFIGSGTTAVAAMKEGRLWIGYDVSETYCRQARERIAANVQFNF
jgi:DNA modification methylase